MNTPHPAPLKASETDLQVRSADDAQPDFSVLLGYERALRRFVRRRTADTHLADDVVQETFLHALSRLPEVRDPERLGAWLFRIAERRLIDAQRRIAAFEQPLLIEPPAPPDDFHGELDDLDSSTPYPELQRALRKLPPSLRRPMRMHSIQGRSVREVARHLGTTVAGVKSRLYRARRMLPRIRSTFTSTTSWAVPRCSRVPVDSSRCRYLSST